MERNTKIKIGAVLIVVALIIALLILIPDYQSDYERKMEIALSKAYKDAALAFDFYDDSIIINATGELPIERIIDITVVNPTNHTLTFDREGMEESYALETFSNIGYFIYHEDEWIPAKYVGNIQMEPYSTKNISLKIVIDNIASAIKGMNHSIDIRFEIVYFLQVVDLPWPICWPILHIDVTVIT